MRIKVDIDAQDLVFESTGQDVIKLILEIDSAMRDCSFSERLFLALAESIECDYKKTDWSELCTKILNLKNT
jgi:hypothetical protein